MLAVAGAVIAIEAIRRGTFVRAVRDPVLALIGLFVALGLVSTLVNDSPVGRRPWGC